MRENKSDMEFLYTYAQLKAVQDRIAEIEKETDAITERRQQGASWDDERERYNALWDERDWLEEREEAMRRAVRPEIGMPCTVCHWSDRSKAKVEKILDKSGKTIQVKQCGVYTSSMVFSLRRNGAWVEKGSRYDTYANHLILAYEEDYFDMSF